MLMDELFLAGEVEVVFVRDKLDVAQPHLDSHEVRKARRVLTGAPHDAYLAWLQLERLAHVSLRLLDASLKAGSARMHVAHALPVGPRAPVVLAQDGLGEVHSLMASAGMASGCSSHRAQYG